MKPKLRLPSLFTGIAFAFSSPCALHAQTVQNIDFSNNSSGGIVLASGDNTFSFTSFGIQYLIVAGGGGGGGGVTNNSSGAGGGGGAGGYLTGTTSIGSTLHSTVTVGNGGNGGTGGTTGAVTSGAKGNNSVAFGFTVEGGGTGAKFDVNGGNGGSGGGAAGRSSASASGGTASAGNAGGSRPSTTTALGAAGGGGAGSAGQSGAASTNAGRAGGSGLSSSITGTATFYAAGGGGGGSGTSSGGSGGSSIGGNGGGNGTAASNGSAGAANTGSGGGGASSGTGTFNGGAGGSGIVVMRYSGPQALTGGTVTTVGGDTVHTFLHSGGGASTNHTLDLRSATIAGDISGSGNIIWNKAGTLTLSATNSYTGNTTINSGTLEVQGSIASSSGITNNAALVFNSGSAQSYANAIGGSGSLTKQGAGTLTLGGNNGYSGATNLNQGTIEVTVNNALGTNAGGTTVSSGAALKLNNVTYSTTEALTINGTGINNGGALVNSGTSSFAGQVTAASNASINAGAGTVNFTGGLVKNGTTLTLTGGGIINVGTIGISGSSANSDLIVDGTTLNANVANDYNGPTFLRNGAILNANVVDALPTANGRTAVTMDDSGSGSSQLNLAASQSIASLTGAVSSSVSLGSSSLTIGTTTGSTEFAGSITGTGGNLIKDGNSTLILSGSNDYTGATTISAGTLSLTTSTTAAGSGGISVAGGSSILEIDSNITIANGITVSNATAKVERKVAAGASYNVGTTGALKSFFNANDKPDTTARILDSVVNSSGSTATLTLGFSDTSTATNDGIRRSDVFNLSGMSPNTVTEALADTDAYVLQIVAEGLASDSVLGWQNGSMWEWAVNGNTGNNATAAMQNFMGSFTAFQTYAAATWSLTNLTDYIGAFGYDANAGGDGVGGVWAVLNHNSSFAAIPEPTTALAGLLLTAGLLRRKRRVAKR